MARRAAGPDEISCDERLAVPGFERMEPAQRCRDKCGNQEKQRIAPLRRDEFSEGATRSALPVSR
jgi:hypothetical protein